MNKTEFAKRLRIQNHWLVDDSNYLVKANLTYGGKVISLEFSPTEGGLFRVSFPRYTFASKISHYASFEPEQRMCQNKSLLFHIVGHLKRVGAWDILDNKNFFRVNVDNKRASYKESSRNMRIRMEKKVPMYRAARKVIDLPADLPPPTVHSKARKGNILGADIFTPRAQPAPVEKPVKKEAMVSASKGAKKVASKPTKKAKRTIGEGSNGSNDFFG